MQRITFYMDESGNRHPDKKADKTREGRDWFALGGFLIENEKIAYSKQLHTDFCNKWSITRPLHFTDMQAHRKAFAWLNRLEQEELDKFWSEYRSFLSSVPGIGVGCVISRPGYFARGYIERYGGNRWLLCRSAFDIVVERATKFALKQGKKLDIVFESDIALNDTVKGYFANLKAKGLEFDGERSAKYTPLTQEDFNKTLGTIEYKDKAHPMVQVADSYIYAIARQKYDRLFHVHRHLRDKGNIINFHLEDTDEIKAMGIKYYCF